MNKKETKYRLSNCGPAADTTEESGKPVARIRRVGHPTKIVVNLARYYLQ